MKKRLTFRLLVMLVTASVLLSSTGLLTMLASAEGLSETTTAIASTGKDETTTEPVKTTEPKVTAEGGKLDPAGPTVVAEGGTLNASPQSVTWLGVDGTTTDMGKASNPYDVFDAAHFLDIQNLINDIGNSDKYFRLTQDIDLSSVTISNFVSYAGFNASLICLNPAFDNVTNGSKDFINLDGNNKTIRNLSVTNSGVDTCAIFGYISSQSVISNVHFDNCSLTVTYSSARVSAVIAVQNKGVIDSCTLNNVSLNMSGTAGDGYSSDTVSLSGQTVYVGSSAMVGDNQGKIMDCSITNTNISVFTRSYVGLAAGQNSGTIGKRDAVTSAPVSVTASTILAVQSDSSAYIGGIAGKNSSSGIIANSSVILTGTGNKFRAGTKVGGISGANAGSVTNCYVQGTVPSSGSVSDTVNDFKGFGGSGGAIFGGITGENTGAVSYCSTKDVGVYFSSSTSNAVFGGIAGTDTNGISNCFASGKQGDYGSTGPNYLVGGIAGSALTGTSLSSCYALVSLSQNAFLGGALLSGDSAKVSMLSATYPSYWSSNVSGWPTQCALNGADTNDLQRNIQALNILPNQQTYVGKSLFTHSWGAAGTSFGSVNSFSASSAYFSVSEGSQILTITASSSTGVSGKIYYSITITLPNGGAAGIGASQQAPVVQQLSIDTVVSANATDNPVVSLANPIILTDASQMNLLRTVNYTNYRLGASLTLPSNWVTSIFTGTLSGYDDSTSSIETITLNKPIFTKIYGSRDATVPVGNNSDTASNLANGYVRDLNLHLTNSILSGVIGSVIGGTVKNVKLTGDAGVVLNAIGSGSDNTGTFINFVRGNSYIYGCFTNINVVISADVANVAGLIGAVDAATATIDNCGSNSDITFSYSGSNLASVGSLIGGINNNSGVIRNCYTGGLVQRGGNIAIGVKATGNLVQNLFWSIKDLSQLTQTAATPANISGADSFIQWSFVEGTTGYVSNDVSYINLSLPPAISAIANAAAGDFTVQVADANTLDVGTLTVQNGNLKIPLSKHAGITTFTTQVTVTQVSTGLKARITVTNGISKGSDGYYQIWTPGDLQYFSANQATYLAASDLKVRLYADLDMTGYSSFAPIGNATAPATSSFRGVFDGNNKTISNLTISGTSYVGLFGYTIGASIADFTLYNANISGSGQFVGGVVGYASGGTNGGTIGKSLTSGIGINVVNSKIISTYSNTAANAGAVIGSVFVATGTLSVNHITVTNSSAKGAASDIATVATGGNIGGVIGNIASTAIAIDTVTISNLTVFGTTDVGGVVGNQAGGTLTVSNVSVTASSSTPSISGTGYVGGVVGKSAAAYASSSIIGCSVTNVQILNAGTLSSTTGATGGIAGWFSGTIGADTSPCTVNDSTIVGACAGGIIGRADSTAGNLQITVKYCTVGGTTAINGAGTSLPVTGGIFGEYGNAYICNINNCYVRSSVAITNGNKAAGILASTSSTSTAVVLTIDHCQSFATINTSISTSNAGGILGYVSGPASYVHVSYCVGGGNITAVGAAGGIVGYQSSVTAFLNATPYVANCYITAVITAGNSGKILGNMNTTSGGAFQAGNILSAFSSNSFSSYPQSISAFSAASGIGGYANTVNTYQDINKPSSANPTFYQHGSASAFSIDGSVSYNGTINVSLTPTSAYACQGWQSENTGRVTVDAVHSTNTTIFVTAVRSIDTGIIADYKNTSVNLYPNSATAENLVFKAFIPIHITNVVHDWGGDGSAGSPFLIKSKDDLVEMKTNLLFDDLNANHVRDAGEAYYFGGYYRVENNITFTTDDFSAGGSYYNGGACFAPLAGTNPDDGSKLPFVGDLNGNGHSISGLVVKSTGATATNVGLFYSSNKIYVVSKSTTYSANFYNLTLSGAKISGDSSYSTYGGILVARADYTTFAGITVSNSSIDTIKNYAGGIVGYATNSVLSNSAVSSTTVSALSTTGSAGGIAGTFGGTIGAVPSSGYDITVTNPIIAAGNAGGIEGFGDSLALNIQYALVSGGSVTSTAVTDTKAAGGIIGFTSGTNDYVFSIIHSKVASGTTVTAYCIAGGIIGKMGVVSVSSYPVNLLAIDSTESYAAVTATGPSTGTSSAGGIAGNITNGLLVKISNSVAGGSAKANKYVGGVIAFIEGTNSLMALNNAAAQYNYNLEKNIVVSAAISSDDGGALMGLVLGYCDNALMPATAYQNLPFVNIKYSSYQYSVGRNMIGNGSINTTTSPVDFKATIYDLNKGRSDTWTSDYRGLRVYNGTDETMTFILGDTPVVLTPSNILLPKLPDYKTETGDFSAFSDSQGLTFTLGGVTAYAGAAKLADFDMGTKTLTKVAGADNSGDMVFSYTNGLKLAVSLVAYDGLLGDGSTGSPYQISRITLLGLVRTLPNMHFIQTADLAFSAADFTSTGAYYNGGLLWEPLKGTTSSVYFTGTYDGYYNGVVHSISGIKIARPSQDYVGLFAQIASPASVKNLNILNATVSGNNYVGALAGAVTGTGAATAVSGVTVRNSSVTSVSTVGTATVPILVGGLVGTESSATESPTVANITNCSVISTSVKTATTPSTTPNLQTNYFMYAGGIAATVQDISGCTADNVTVNAFLYAGGISARTSNAGGTSNSPVQIINCSVTAANGGSQIIATGTTLVPTAGGILAYINKTIQNTISGCSVASAVTVKSTNGSAGGILGSLAGPFNGGSVNNDLKNSIINTQSYATVTAVADAGGIIGSIKGNSINLANMLVEGSVGGGEVDSTGASGSSGGIIGNVTGTGFAATSVKFFKDDIISALINAATANKGKLVGNCTSITSILDANYPTVFVNNYISTYPQPLTTTPYFGNAGMSASTNLTTSIRDLMKCNGDVAFTVDTVIGGSPTGIYRSIAIATYDSDNPHATDFRAKILVWNGTSAVDLSTTGTYAIGSSSNSLSFAGVSVTTSATVSWPGPGSSDFTINPPVKAAGYVEVSLGYGLKISVPLVTFDIKGSGLANNPFQIATAEHLTLMYYLPNASYQQVANIAISLTDYQLGGVLYNAGTIYEGKGFMPIGYDTDTVTTGFQGQQFTGNYDGQGYKITGLFSGFLDAEYVGFFGNVASTAVLKNIHIELMENTNTTRYGISGKRYVGGLAGYCTSSAAVENCSVTYGTVAGQQMVGGLIGYSSSSIIKCFTTCDVLGVGKTGTGAFPGEAGGLVGRVYNPLYNNQFNISNSFATGSIYSGNQQAGGLVGSTNCASNSKGLYITNCFFTGDVKAVNTTNPYLLVGSGYSNQNQGTVNGQNIFVAGTNTSFNASMNPFSGQSTQGGTNNLNIYFDNSMLGLTGTTQGTAQTTAQLTTAVLPTGFSGTDWQAVSGTYPRLIMEDYYSNAYSAIATLPLQVDTKDYNNSGTLADGMIYPVKVADKVDGNTITLTSSKLDAADTVAYPSAMDPSLTGNGSDRSVDLLFGPSSGGTRTVYRNIFITDSYPSSSNLTFLNIQNGELWYDCKTPIVTMAATVNGETVTRSMKIPLESAANTYYIATERQLRALSSTTEVTGTKFNIYSNAINNSNAYNSIFMLTADINLRGDQTGADFEPIATLKGTFLGNNYTVSKLLINKTSSDNIGLFKQLDGTNTTIVAGIYDLNLADVWVTGRNNVGALAGVTNQFSTVSNCKVYQSGTAGVSDSLVTGNETIGGLIGKNNLGVISNGSRTAVHADGKNVVGGFVGTSNGDIQNCLSTGSVTATITNTGTSFGIGGFAGALTAGGLLKTSFSSSNVYVSNVDDFDNVAGSKYIGIGGLVGTYSTGCTLNACFASGYVKAYNVGILRITSTYSGSGIIFGVGGVAGINQSLLVGCYSSSSVDAVFTGDVSGATGSLVAAGVGGVVGVSLNTVNDAYSSGSVLRKTLPDLPDDIANVTYFKEAIGGVIGTEAGSSASGYAQLYFDLWTSSYGSDLQAIGGINDVDLVRSLTTDQLTISQALHDTNTTPLKLSNTFWSFNSGAYPCLISLVQDTSKPYILYPAILSVVAVTPDSRDTSAKLGNGITMAITTPNSLTILANTYNLTWAASANSDIPFMQYTVGGTTSKFVPIRTSNASQILRLDAWVTGFKTYGVRSFDRPCSEMLGTVDKPYLVASKSDLQHIGLTSAGIAAVKAQGFTNFYDTWFSPVTIDESGQCTNLEGKVYFKLLSDIDMTRDVTYNFDPTTKAFEGVTISDPNPSTPLDDNHFIPSLANEVYPANDLYPAGIPFLGISMAGNDYSIDNFTSTKEFIYGISSDSEVDDVSFTNLNINSVGTADENLGTALVRYNQGTIDGCMILSGNITGGSNVASIAATNFANISNSVVTATVSGVSNVGGVAANNAQGTLNGIYYTGQINNCAFTGTVSTAQTAGTAANAGGIAGTNGANISNCFTMGSVTAANGAATIGGVVGLNDTAGNIIAAYSRANVSGTVTGSDFIGGFAGNNKGTITNAFSAGKVTVTSGASQTGIFCGTNTGTLTDTFADKAMSGKSTYKLVADAAMTEKIINMACFSSGGSAATYFALTSATAYPQLKSILSLPVTGSYIPQKIKLLMGYSAVSAATVNTKYSQYIDTLATSSANPTSTITSGYSWLTSVTWTTTNSSVMSITGNAGSSANTATLTATAVITASNGKIFTASLPIAVGVGTQNPNFALTGNGKGSSAYPYMINSADSFNSLAYYGSDSEIYYVVTTDINYAGFCPPTAITEFTGHLDGQKYVIYDLTVNNNSGLFKHLNTGSVISNLGLVGAKTTTASTEGYAGLLAGNAQGAVITNCYAIGEINISGGYVGGLIGLANAGTIITGCLTSGKIVNTSSDGASNVGGIVGCVDTASVTGSFSTAYVRGAAGNIGGIVGKLVNGSTASNDTFAGMVMDTALANGASVPTVLTIGNIAGSKLDTSAITGCFFDKQISLIPDTNAAAKFTAELMNGASYTVNSGLSGGSAKYAAGVAFAAMPIKYLLGSAAGSTSSFSKISLPWSISGDNILITEVPQDTGAIPQRYYLTSSGNPIIITLVSHVDLADVFAGLKVNLSTGTGTNFAGMTNQILRYTEPRLCRIIKVSYTLTNNTGVTGLNTQTIAVQVKNKHIFAGDPVTYTSDAFTTVSSTASVFEDLVVSAGGIYAAGTLPAGYNYQITAQDQNGAYLLGSAGNGVTLASPGGEYGGYIPLSADTTQIVINYTIVNNAPWGVYKLWNSLADTLVH